MRLNLGAAPEDFFVEELPAYPFEGAGEHLCLLVEKRGLTTDALVRAVARACRAKVGEIGVAGRKDRHAVTRQWLTVRGAGDAEVPAIEAELGPAARVLEVARHRTKLRLGHLAGNRFVLRLYGDAQASSGARAALEASLARVARDGLRNRFDTQRFGVAGATLALARAWGARDFEAAVRFVVDPEGTWQPSDPVPERALVSGPQARVASAWQRRPGHARAALGTAARDLRPLAASAAQAAVFNAVLDARAAAGLLHTLRPGDLVRRARGRPFRCTEALRETLHAEAAPGVLEVLATGPLPGADRFLPSEQVLAEERAWSSGCGIDWAWMAEGGELESPGDRRPLVVPLLEPARVVCETSPLPSAGTARHGAGDPIPPAGTPAETRCLRVSFALPRGAYATQLLREIGVALEGARAAAGGSATLGA